MEDDERLRRPELTDQEWARLAPLLPVDGGGRPPGFDPQGYKRRNSVERAITRLKQNRAVATRYDKRDYVWRGTGDGAAIRIWLRDPTQ